MLLVVEPIVTSPLVVKATVSLRTGFPLASASVALAVDVAASARSPGTYQERSARMMPLYAARIEDLGQGDFVKVDCAACHHVALLPLEALLKVGLSRGAKVLDLKGRFRCRGCGRKGRAVVSVNCGSVKWRGRGASRVTTPWACLGMLPGGGRAGAPGASFGE